MWFRLLFGCWFLLNILLILLLPIESAVLPRVLPIASLFFAVVRCCAVCVCVSLGSFWVQLLGRPGVDVCFVVHRFD